MSKKVAKLVWSFSGVCIFLNREWDANLSLYEEKHFNFHSTYTHDYQGRKSKVFPYRDSASRYFVLSINGVILTDEFNTPFTGIPFIFPKVLGGLEGECNLDQKTLDYIIDDGKLISYEDS